MKHNENQIKLIGTSNSPWLIDHSVRRRFGIKCYIPLPDMKRRKDIIKNSGIGDPLDDDLIETICKASEGFSVSDLEIALKNGEMEPARRCFNSKHFKKIFLNDENMFSPCSVDDVDAIEISLNQIPQNKLHFKIERDDLTNSFSCAKKTVTDIEVKMFETFRKEYDDL
jgi:SpoVK/Ycf46/Vps4 family AAA+-type ATPase